MRWTLRLGSIAGIRVELHVTFLLFVGWVAISGGLLSANPERALREVGLLLAIFGCVLLHELGHALTARRYGIKTRDIILLPIGGVARLQRMPDKPQQEMVVAIAGPLVNVVIASILYLFTPRSLDLVLQHARQGGMIERLYLVNLAMIGFNMIPAFPMDGGRVLRALLALWLPYRRATRIASFAGQAIALLFGLTGLLNNNVMLMFVALFVFLAASEERALVQNRATLSGLPVKAAMVTDFRTLDVSDPLQRAVDHLMAGSQQDFPVLDSDRPIGILTRSELVMALQQHGTDVRVGDVIRPDDEYVDAGEPLEEAIQRMREQSRTALPVLQHGGLVGLITLENVGDLLVVQDALQRHAGGRAV
jgi:Zn-dependent protease/predicted transcriptional regulator